MRHTGRQAIGTKRLNNSAFPSQRRWTVQDTSPKPSGNNPSQSAIALRTIPSAEVTGNRFW